MQSTRHHFALSTQEVEDASQRDRCYFELHPDAHGYVRRRMPGEFGRRDTPPSEWQERWVEVTQVAPGYRIRRPIHVMRHSDYPRGEIPFEHLEAAMHLAVTTGGTWRWLQRGEVDETVWEGGDAT